MPTASPEAVRIAETLNDLHPLSPAEAQLLASATTAKYSPAVIRPELLAAVARLMLLDLAPDEDFARIYDAVRPVLARHAEEQQRDRQRADATEKPSRRPYPRFTRR